MDANLAVTYSAQGKIVMPRIFFPIAKMRKGHQVSLVALPGPSPSTSPDFRPAHSASVCVPRSTLECFVSLLASTRDSMHPIRTARKG